MTSRSVGSFGGGVPNGSAAHDGQSPLVPFIGQRKHDAAVTLMSSAKADDFARAAGLRLCRDHPAAQVERLQLAIRAYVPVDKAFQH